MTQYKLKLSEGAAIFTIFSLAVLVVCAATRSFQAFSFPWIAWCALGYGAIVTLGREMISVRDPSDGPPAGLIESCLNRTLALLLSSTPAWFVAVAVVLTLLFASIDTFGILPTLASGGALYFLVKHALRVSSKSNGSEPHKIDEEGQAQHQRGTKTS